MSVIAINRSQNLCLMVGGHTWPVSVWLDDDGDECGATEAVMAVIGPVHDEYRKEFWVTLDLADFDEVTTQ